MQSIKGILKAGQIEASAPCRIDMGGTLDISTFYYPLRHLSPCTFNIAVNLRTRVCLFPYKEGIVKISSRGFKSAKYSLDKAPFNHPLGFMFAIAAYFRAEGVHIDIDSASPPRSALGGSSAAAVALIAAFSKLSQMQTADLGSRQKIALLAHALEESVAGVPCGLQDQLAAVYGGVNAWYWPAIIKGPSFRKKTIVKKAFHKSLNKHLLLAYCGIPHESKNINTRWVEQFISGKYRKFWAEIIACTQRFSDALLERDFKEACASMNRETAIRRKMTPDVLDNMGAKLVGLAVKNRCGARFTGAGGGGCISAIGEVDDIARLKDIWEKALLSRKEAYLLDVDIDSKGLVVN
jgi:D-glycero-alpha-D-manno-heptose-7-phosphate kinase